MQRVAIARALVNDPEIILADEPTGNLDSKNTIEVMNIIKSISQDKLVILVTHESNLATFYASRIINIEDGVLIKDVPNDHEDELDYRIDNKLYLLDFPKHEKISNKYSNIELYSDTNDSVSLKIVIKKGNVYIKADNNEKVEVVDENSNIELVNDKYKKISKKDYEKSNFDLNELDNSNINLKYSSIYNPISMIKSGVKKVFNYSLIKKILLIGFFVSAMFIVYAISNIFGSTNIRDDAFLTRNRSYIEIKNQANKIEEYTLLSKMDGINYVIPGNSLVNFMIESTDLYQFSSAMPSISASIADTSLISTVITGEKPEEKLDICIDKMIVDKIMDSSEIKMLGLVNYESFIGKKLVIKDLKFNITGICDENSPSVYFDKSLFSEVIANTSMIEDNIEPYTTASDVIVIKQGRMPINDYEAIVNIDYKDVIPLGKTVDVKVNGNKLKVVGYYFSKYGVTNYYVSDNTLNYKNIVNSNSYIISASDNEKIIKKLKEKGFNAKSVYEIERQEYIEDVKDSIIEHLIIAGILLVISFVEIYLMVRASFLSRIKEVGIYRAVGVKKTDIYKMFLGEILVITTIAIHYNEPSIKRNI